jgi:predicted extracellular nuclease
MDRKWLSFLRIVAGSIVLLLPLFSSLASHPLASQALFLSSAGLIINEVDYDQPDTDTAEFVEIKNASGASINLDGYRLDLVNGYNSSVYGTVDLPAVDLAAGAYYVVCGNAANVPNCDLDVTPDSNLVQNGAPDAVALVLDADGTIVDTVSYEGDTSAPYTEGSGAGLEDPWAVGMGLSRCPDGTDTDQNNVDFTVAGITPGDENDCPSTTLVVNEMDYDQPDSDTAEFIEIENVGGVSINLDGYRLDLVNGSGGGAALYQSIDLPAVDLAAGGYYVVCGNAANVPNCDLDVTPDSNLIQNGAPDAVALVLDADGTIVDTVSYEGDTGVPYTEGSGTGLEEPDGVAGVGLSRCLDGTDTNRNNVDFALVGITPGEANDTCPGAFADCGDPATLIHDVQGSGSASPMLGAQDVVLEGVVIGDFQDTSTELGGFFLQEENCDADADPTTSEGIFVYDSGFGVPVSEGDVVRVQGTVDEFYDLTELKYISNLVVCSSGASVTAAQVDLPVVAIDDLERNEGMLVTLPQVLHVTEHYNLGRYGEVWVSVGGRLYNPTHLTTPGTPANDQQDLNDRSRLLIDDGSEVQNPAVVPYLAADNTLRLGDSITGLTGALGYSYSNYRLHPTVGVAFARTDERPAAPEETPSALTVASFNVLNYFNGDGQGGGFPTSRGADTPSEFHRQRTKIISATLAMEADILGLMELENDGYGEYSAIQDLVNGLNDIAGADTYAFIDPGVAQIGSDEIAVGFIYKPATVSPVGAAAILDSSVDPTFIDDRNRPALAQTFAEDASGEMLTIVVNHLKSKGSACDDIGDQDTGDGQGNCNLTRTSAANALVNWLLTDPTGSGDNDYLIIGDLNSYANEDPIVALENGGYTDLIETFVGEGAYSYVFDGQVGYLDHALANPTLMSKVVGATVWHINADEPRILDYNQEYNPPELYSPDAYRASDHDPVLVRLNLLSRVYLPLVTHGHRPKPIIEEVQYAGSGEYVVITNQGLVPQDLTGWQIQSVIGNQWYDFPAGYVLDPGGSVWVRSGPAAYDNPPADLLWTVTYVWDDRGDQAILYDDASNVVDDVCYGSGCP